MSHITPQWVNMNPFEAAARLNELERENAALRALTKEASLALDGNWHERVDMIKKLDAIDAARKEAQP